MKRMIDAPEGWRYGFPKAIPDDVNQDTIEQWFLDEGYPQKLIDQGMLKYCRQWLVMEEDVSS